MAFFIDFIIKKVLLLYSIYKKENKMFDSIEIRKASNGFIVILTPEDNDPVEYVFDTSRKALKFIRTYVEAKVVNAEA